MTKEIEWGPEIAVDGKRPEWLRDDDRFMYRGFSHPDWWECPAARSFSFGREDGGVLTVTRIRLPADHPYYRATAAGFTYWPGGDEAPAGSIVGVMFRDGTQVGREGADFRAMRWTRGGNSGDIIGYCKRPVGWSVQFGDTAINPGLVNPHPTYDPATHVAVPLMTELEAFEWLQRNAVVDYPAMLILRTLGLLKAPPTPLDRFMTAHPAADRETAEMVLAWKDGQ